MATALATALVGCRPAAVDTVDAAPSPQARAEPAPLATPPSMAATATAAAARLEVGSAPEPLRGDQPVAPDTPREAVREPGARDASRDAKGEQSGYALEAVLHTGDAPPPPKGPEVNAAAIEAAKRRAEPRIAIELSPTRARLVLLDGFVVPQTTELRARVDRYGHVLLWPGEDTYRIVEAGAMRALLGERRLDVAPLSLATAVSAGDGARRLDVHTRRVEVSTRAANATLELATLRDAGDGGVLLCRWLLDLMNAPPSTPACTTDEVPLHAELRWTTLGALSFDVTALARRPDLAPQEMAVPPASRAFVASPPPVPAAELLLTRSELAAFRTAPVDVPAAEARDAQPPRPEAGLALTNSSDELRVVWVDGAPAAWLAPGGRLTLSSLVRGRYLVQWRTFLGDSWERPETVVVPGASEVGGRGGS